MTFTRIGLKLNDTWRHAHSLSGNGSVGTFRRTISTMQTWAFPLQINLVRIRKLYGKSTQAGRDITSCLVAQHKQRFKQWLNNG
jgi:hypothetical protein